MWRGKKKSHKAFCGSRVMSCEAMSAGADDNKFEIEKRFEKKNM